MESVEQLIDTIMELRQSNATNDQFLCKFFAGSRAVGEIKAMMCNESVYLISQAGDSNAPNSLCGYDIIEDDYLPPFHLTGVDSFNNHLFTIDLESRECQLAHSFYL